MNFQRRQIGNARAAAGGLNRRPTRRRHQQQHSQGDPADVALFEISWRPSFETGHPLIDSQHRRLFGLANEVINAVLTDRSKGTIEVMLDELVDHITDHFCAEEVVLAQSRYPLSQEHHEQHSSLLELTRGLRKKFNDGEIHARELVAFIAYDIITGHVMKEDIRWVPLVAEAKP